MIDYPKPEQLTGEDADDYRDEHEGVDPPHTWFITDEYGYTGFPRIRGGVPGERNK